MKYAEKNEQHHTICQILNHLYSSKNEDYDDAFAKSFKEYGMSMPCIRLEDKLNRLKALTVKGTTQNVKEESIRDTLLDIANYAIMTIIELEEKQNGIK
jgi:hypothetical protein